MSDDLRQRVSERLTVLREWREAMLVGWQGARYRITRAWPHDPPSRGQLLWLSGQGGHVGSYADILACLDDPATVGILADLVRQRAPDADLHTGVITAHRRAGLSPGDSAGMAYLALTEDECGRRPRWSARERSCSPARSCSCWARGPSTDEPCTDGGESMWTQANALIAAALEAADALERLGQDGDALRQAGFTLLRALGPPAADWAEPHLRALWDGAQARVGSDWNVVYDMTHQIGHLQQALVYLAERNRPDRPGVHTAEDVMRRHLELALTPVVRRPAQE